jgi:hypothetical protein
MLVGSTKEKEQWRLQKKTARKGKQQKKKGNPKRIQEEMRKRRENQTLLQTPIQVYVAHKP